MKLTKPGTSAGVVRGNAKQKVESETGGLAVDAMESVETVDQTDRFEVGSQQAPRHEDEDADAQEEQRLFADALDDPELAKTVTLPVMIGSESLPSNIEASLKGILALVDTEEDGA